MYDDSRHNILKLHLFTCQHKFLRHPYFILYIQPTTTKRKLRMAETLRHIYSSSVHSNAFSRRPDFRDRPTSEIARLLRPYVFSERLTLETVRLQRPSILETAQLQRPSAFRDRPTSETARLLRPTDFKQRPSDFRDRLPLETSILRSLDQFRLHLNLEKRPPYKLRLKIILVRGWALLNLNAMMRCLSERYLS